jgi:DNA adenine methylase/adenine-specific DNA-methyltransferase
MANHPVPQPGAYPPARPAFMRVAEDLAILGTAFPAQAAKYPEFRYMGSKHRLLPWLHGILAQLDFETAEDPFSGSGSVAYLLKAMGKSVRTSDFLAFPVAISTALIANSHARLTDVQVDELLTPRHRQKEFIRETFSGIFFTPAELTVLDTVWANLSGLPTDHHRALALAALIRSCMKRQPRGVFTVANGEGGRSRYDDGRRDLLTPLDEHFREQVVALNDVVFDSGRACSATRSDVFATGSEPPDLVYLDPPYVPRADDNCYVKRYHFLEGLATYWHGVRILQTSKVRKIEKPYTPFSYRKDAYAAFDQLFAKYRASTILLSYSDNAFPNRSVLGEILGRYKRAVTVHERAHRYHFGTHAGVSRAETMEYVLVGTD